MLDMVEKRPTKGPYARTMHGGLAGPLVDCDFAYEMHLCGVHSSPDNRETLELGGRKPAKPTTKGTIIRFLTKDDDNESYLSRKPEDVYIMVKLILISPLTYSASYPNDYLTGTRRDFLRRIRKLMGRRGRVCRGYLTIGQSKEFDQGRDGFPETVPGILGRCSSVFGRTGKYQRLTSINCSGHCIFCASDSETRSN